MAATLKTLFTIAALISLADLTFARNHGKAPGVIVNWKDIPAAVQTTFQSNAGGGKVKEVEKQTANAVVLYWAEVKGTDGKWTKICVNESGALIRVEPDKARNKRKHKPLFGD